MTAQPTEQPTEQTPAPPNTEAAVLQDVVHVLGAIRRGDFNRWLHVPHEGPGREPARAINEELGRVYILLQRLVAEVTRVTGSIGTDGQFGREADVPEAAGAWRQLVDSLNEMSTQLTIQIRSCNQALAHAAAPDATDRVTVGARGETQALVAAINAVLERHRGGS